MTELDGIVAKTVYLFQNINELSERQLSEQRISNHSADLSDTQHIWQAVSVQVWPDLVLRAEKLPLRRDPCAALTMSHHSNKAVGMLLHKSAKPDRTSMVVRPPSLPKRMSVSNRSPTMQIWCRSRPNESAMLASMNSAGLPTTIGSRFVDPAGISAPQDVGSRNLQNERQQGSHL